MEVKKFEAPTLAQALQVVKRELGPEAIILSTKNNKSSFGLMNRSSVEVTAAVSPEAFARKIKAEQRMSPEQKETLMQKPAQKVIQAYDILSGNRLSQQVGAARAGILTQSQKTQNHSQEQRQRPPTQRRYIDIQDDDSPAEQMIERTADKPKIRQEASGAAATLFAKLQHRGSSPQKAEAAPQVQAKVRVDAVLPQLMAMLSDAGLDAETIRELSDELKAIMIRDQIIRLDILKLQLARLLMGRIRVAKPLGERLRNPGTPRIITFLGPTGVGKTTTVAKIAAELVINQRRQVVLATTDTFKIAAVEQLQTYANILKIPLEVCPNPEALAQLTANLGPDEVVLLDTAGYGPKDEKRLEELKQTLGDNRMESHLCVSATTRDHDLFEIVRRFHIYEPNYLVVTKLDETSMFGNIFNLAAKSHLPLSYFTMGQRVPEDMEVATKERLADLILQIGEEGVN